LAPPAGGVYRGGMPSPIDFYFDFSSPYSYIAGEWVDALAARHSRTVRRQAILLGATFQAAELKPPVALPDQARILGARLCPFGTF
jgi:2-hydroxychromene-2-carboxylate isomerase